jgi:hypothetical protein
MDEITQLWNEYNSLREESKTADSLNYQILGIMVAAVALILTHAFSAGSWWYKLMTVLCVYIVTIPAYRLLVGNRRRIWRISTYLRVIIEPRIIAKWESRLKWQRDNEKEPAAAESDYSSHVIDNEWFIVNLVNWSAAVAAIIVTVNKDNRDLRVSVGIAVALAIFNVWLAWKTLKLRTSHGRGKNVEEGFAESWRNIRDRKQ